MTGFIQLEQCEKKWKELYLQDVIYDNRPHYLNQG